MSFQIVPRLAKAGLPSIAVAFALLAPLAGAEARGYDLPQGPYRQECIRERVENGYLLRATCPKRDGALRDSSLDLRTCPRGSFVYNDGAYLRCGDGGQYRGWDRKQTFNLPPGPYRQDCRQERVEEGYLLRATCPKRNGEWRDSSIDLRTCPRGTLIYNEGAYLRCH